MNLFEKTIRAVAPTWAAKRSMARYQQFAYDNAISVLGGQGYDALKAKHGHDNWTRPTGGPNQLAGAAKPLADSARDLVRNNALASHGVRVWTNLLIGQGIRPQADSGDKALNKRIDDNWRRWADSADPNDELDFYGLQRLGAKSYVPSGETLFYEVRRSRNSVMRQGLPSPLQYQLIEPDMLDNTKTEHQGNIVIGGVEIDDFGRIVAYHLYSDFAVDVRAFRRQSIRVPKDRLLRAYEKQRPGQLRGVSPFHSVMTRLKQLDDFEHAELVLQKVAACLAAFVRTPNPDDDGMPMFDTQTGEANTDSSVTGNNDMALLEPGMVSHLGPGEDITFSNPPNVQPRDFAKRQHTLVAVGLGLTYDMLTGDLSGANYSSLKAGRIVVQGIAKDLRQDVFVQPVLRRVWQRFQAFEVMMGRQSQPVPAKWIAPQFESLDPLKDAQADKMNARAGFKSLKQILAEKGQDFEDHVSEIENCNTQLDDAGIVLDSDPRRIAGGGTMQSGQPLTDQE